MATKETTHFKSGLVRSIKVLRDDNEMGNETRPLGLETWNSLRAVSMEWELGVRGEVMKKRESI